MIDCDCPCLDEANDMLDNRFLLLFIDCYLRYIRVHPGTSEVHPTCAA